MFVLFALSSYQDSFTTSLLFIDLVAVILLLIDSISEVVVYNRFVKDSVRTEGQVVDYQKGVAHEAEGGVNTVFYLVVEYLINDSTKMISYSSSCVSKLEEIEENIPLTHSKTFPFYSITKKTIIPIFGRLLRNMIFLIVFCIWIKYKF
jgi:hypothetical protein